MCSNHIISKFLSKIMLSKKNDMRFNLENFLKYVCSKKNYIEIYKKKISEVLFKADNFDKNLSEEYKTFVSFILSIQYTPINTRLQLSDCSGLLLLGCSAGHFVKGKRKKSRVLILKKFFNRAFLKFPDLQNKPVSLHLFNVSNKIWVVKYLKKKIFITAIKSFNLFPHNGCRAKKIKRKKYKRKLKI